MKLKYTILISLTILLGFTIPTLAANKADFTINTDTEFAYVTGNDYVTVTTEYIRKVENSNYYFPADGERIFHIPDATTGSEESIKKEREFKLSALTVKNEFKKDLTYEVEDLPTNDGIYIKVKNYRTTTRTSPYQIILTYNTHDYVLKAGNYITLIGTSLPADVKFQETEEANGTVTDYNYYFTISTDKNIPPLSKIFPKFTKSENSSNTYYKFSQTDRMNNPPILEFGTKATYKFELSYSTPKTDNITPVASVLQSISTNIFEISLPREFAETNQKVTFENVSPTPKKIHIDDEGNMLATFEVPANQESQISITGFITVEQSEYEKQSLAVNIDFNQYLAKIKEWDLANSYLKSTKFWQSTDSYIVQTANNLMKDQRTLLDVIKADYKFVNDTLEYDDEKANSDNERIGAVAALSGGKSVCMEYADAMIAILRAQGIPARAALGYANIVEENKEQIRHQWVQIWVPDYGWLSVDPTFESENMKIGQMIDRVLWETFNNDSLSNIMIYSADRLNDLDNKGFSLKIYAYTDPAEVQSVKTYTELLPNENQSIESLSKYKISNWFNTFLKATVAGRALLITIPVLVSILFLFALITVVKVSYRKTKNKQNKKQLTNKDLNKQLLKKSSKSK